VERKKEKEDERILTTPLTLALSRRVEREDEGKRI